MPIKTIDLTQPPGFLVQVCAACGVEHTITFDRGAAETKVAPFALADGATLEIAVDGASATRVTFTGKDAKSLAAVAAGELRAKLAAVAHLTAVVSSAGTVIVESVTAGPKSRIEITGGTAREPLGFMEGDPCPGRPVLGYGAAPFENSDVIPLRGCGCGAYEMVNRTWDVAPVELAGTQFYEQRRAVNFLAEHFKAKGWLHPDLVAAIASEKTPPADRHPEGTKLIAVPFYA